jgi:predicted RND superfamily exporter protein
LATCIGNVIHPGFQAQLSGTDDVLDEEVVLLSDAVMRLKGMAKQIGEESKETGRVQEAVAKQMEAAQVAMTAGVRKMKRLHREMTSSCGHMLVLAIYAVVLVLGVVFLTKVKTFLGWILKWVLWRK